MNLIQAHDTLTINFNKGVFTLRSKVFTIFKSLYFNLHRCYELKKKLSCNVNF